MPRCPAQGVHKTNCKQGIYSWGYQFSTNGSREKIVEKMPCRGSYALSATRTIQRNGTCTFDRFCYMEQFSHLPQLDKAFGINTPCQKINPNVLRFARSLPKNLENESRERTNILQCLQTAVLKCSYKMNKFIWEHCSVRFALLNLNTRVLGSNPTQCACP